MNEKEVVLSTKALGKYFYDPIKFKVLDDISFEAYKGEFLTLVGKSGCGKSTLLYCLSTMDTTYEGELFIKGEKITGKKTNELAALRNSSIGFIYCRSLVV
jgi:lipoprotein-releasing system ATP-binding protein